jgi:hypothetical protein
MFRTARTAAIVTVIVAVAFLAFNEASPVIGVPVAMAQASVGAQPPDWFEQSYVDPQMIIGSASSTYGRQAALILALADAVGKFEQHLSTHSVYFGDHDYEIGTKAVTGPFWFGEASITSLLTYYDHSSSGSLESSRSCFEQMVKARLDRQPFSCEIRIYSRELQLGDLTTSVTDLMEESTGLGSGDLVSELLSNGIKIIDEESKRVRDTQTCFVRCGFDSSLISRVRRDESKADSLRASDTSEVFEKLEREVEKLRLKEGQGE